MAIPVIKMATIGLLPSPLKKFYYRLRGAKIGKNVTIGLLSILNGKEIIIEDNASIGHVTFITARKIRIGKRVKINMMVAIETGEFEINNDSVIMEQIVIGGMLTPRSSIYIGKRVKIFPYSFLNTTEKIIIEDDVGIGGANYIFTHGSWQSILDGFPVNFGPVTIKKGAWFPWRVFVMPNVTVGEYATIGAGSVITKDIPPRSLAVGSPAKVIKQGSEYIKEYSKEEKLRILVKIIEEMAAYFSFKFGKPFHFNSVDNSEIIAEITVPNGKKIICANHFEFTGNEVAVISFTPINKAIIKELNGSGIAWFDIEGKQTFYRYRDVYWSEIKDFFSRYGIHFEIES